MTDEIVRYSSHSHKVSGETSTIKHINETLKSTCFKGNNWTTICGKNMFAKDYEYHVI